MTNNKYDPAVPISLEFEAMMKEKIENKLKLGGEQELFIWINDIIKDSKSKVFLYAFNYIIEKYFPQYLEKVKMLVTFS